MKSQKVYASNGALGSSEGELTETQDDAYSIHFIMLGK